MDYLGEDELVRFQRNNGVKKRSNFNLGKFKFLKKTFGGNDKKVTNSKVCTKCTKDSSKAGEPVHAYFDCRQRAGASRGAGSRRGAPVQATTDVEVEAESLMSDKTSRTSCRMQNKPQSYNT